MMWPTHAAFGITGLWLLSPFSPELVEVDFSFLAVFGASCLI
jgi:hypothetical protein